MAESYVTKFTKYVAEQRDLLESVLKDKGFPVNKNTSLGGLTSLINSAGEHFSYSFEYDRDPNFPNIDTMFDNDTLRFANGGEYKYCVYCIVRVFDDNLIIFPYNYCNASGVPYFSKVYLGDSIVVDIPHRTNSGTPSVVQYVLSEEEQNQLIVGEDGFKYMLGRVYYNDGRISGTETTLYAFPNYVEGIFDNSNILGSLSTTASSGATTSNVVYVGTRYIRFPLSNATAEIVLSSSSGTSLNISPIEMLRIDGLHKLSTLTTSASNIALYGNYCKNPTSTATTATIKIGSTNSNSSAFTKGNLGTVITPYSPDIPLNIEFIGCAPSNLVIQENTVGIGYTSGTYGGTNPFTYAKTITLPSSIEKCTAFSSRNKNITFTQGAFGSVINTTAQTVDFSNCYVLPKETIIDFFNKIADRTELTANIVTIPKQINIQLTDEEKAIATNKNWTISVGSY